MLRRRLLPPSSGRFVSIVMPCLINLFRIVYTYLDCSLLNVTVSSSDYRPAESNQRRINEQMNWEGFGGKGVAV
jgi:hypothetical protein